MSHQHFGLLAASTGSTPGVMLQFQLLLDEFFAYANVYCGK
jgi:hypothetical protein